MGIRDIVMSWLRPSRPQPSQTVKQVPPCPCTFIPEDFYDDEPGKRMIARFNDARSDRERAILLKNPAHNRLTAAARFVVENGAEHFGNIPQRRNNKMSLWLAEVFGQGNEYGLQ